MAEKDKLFLVTRYVQMDYPSQTNVLLYAPHQKLAVDITSVAYGRPNLCHPAEMQVLPDEKTNVLQQYVTADTRGEGKMQGYFGNETIYFKEVVGEHNLSVIEALTNFRKARINLGELLNSTGIIQNAHPEERIKAVPSAVSPLDPSTMDSTTRTRLEEIVGQCGNNALKKKFFPPQQTEELRKAEFELGKDSFEREIRIELGDRLIQAYEDGSEGSVLVDSYPDNSPINVTHVLGWLDRGVEKGFIDEEDRRAKVLEMYNRMTDNDKYSASLRLHLVHKFKLDEQFPEQVTPEAMAQLKQRRLAELLPKYGLARGRYNLEKELKEKGEELPNSYIGWIKKAAEGIPAEVVFNLASRAYEELIKPDPEFGSREEERDYLQAAMLAREYLMPRMGEEILLSVGKKLVENSPLRHWTADIGYWHQSIEEDFTYLKLPEEMTKPMWLRMLVGAVENGYSQIADKIKQNHVLPDEEIRAAVSQPYELALLKGEFIVASRLGDYFAAQLPESIVPFIDDLRKLAGIEEYARLEAEKKERRLEL